MRITQAENGERQSIIDWLNEVVHKGDVVYTINRFRGRTGRRVIDMLVWSKEENRPYYIGRQVAKLIGAKWDDKYDGVVTGGYGMDFGYDLVYRLAEALFSEPYALGHRWL